MLWNSYDVREIYYPISDLPTEKKSLHKISKSICMLAEPELRTKRTADYEGLA